MNGHSKEWSIEYLKSISQMISWGIELWSRIGKHLLDYVDWWISKFAG